jgi:hypothetical protein
LDFPKSDTESFGIAPTFIVVFLYFSLVRRWPFG